MDILRDKPKGKTQRILEHIALWSLGITCALAGIMLAIIFLKVIFDMMLATLKT